MKRKTLASLLAIPVFSLAAAFNAPNYSLSATTYDSFYQESQESKKIKTTTVAAAAIDFLLRGKVADKMKMTSDEKLVLGLIGDLLGTQGQREHELDVAAAGRDQLIINTTDGRQAQVVKDAGGNIYLVMDGTIYPIAQELVNQARSLPTSLPSIGNATLPPYNLSGLESKFNANPKEDISQYYWVQEGGEYLSDIARKLDVPESNIFYWVDTSSFFESKSKYELRPISKQKEIWENRKKIKKSLPFSSHKALWIVKEKWKNEISTIFSYKWHQDLNNDGVFEFNEFNQIRRTFYNDEDFNIVIVYQTEKGFIGNLELKILEDYTGKLIMNEKIDITLANGGPMIKGYHISAEERSIGAYLIHANLKNDIISETVSSASERFEIIQKPSEIKK